MGYLKIKDEIFFHNRHITRRVAKNKLAAVELHYTLLSKENRIINKEMFLSGKSKI